MKQKLTFLKNSLLGLFFISLLSFDANAQWTLIGAADFVTGAGRSKVQVYNDTVYFAFGDGANNGRMSMMKYDGSSWALVGQAGFTAVQITSGFDFEISNTGELYIAHNNAPSSGGVTVMKYENGAWGNVGVANMSNGSAEEPDLAFDSTNTPYIAYAYNENIPTSAEIAVKKFDGTNWVLVGSGSVGFATSGSTVPSHPGIEFNANGELFVAYIIGGGAARFAEFDGTNWTNKGNFFGLQGGSVRNLVFDSNEKPFMLLNTDIPTSTDEARVLTPEVAISGDWEYVGGATIGFGDVDYASLAIDGNDNLYVTQADQDPSNGDYGISVFVFDGTNWGLLGGTRFKATNCSRPSSTISDNVLYISYNNPQGATSVEKYDLTVGVTQIPTLNKEINVYPNPTDNQLMIEGVENIGVIRILTMDGKVVQTITTNRNTISVESLPQGIYTIEVVTEEGVGYKQFVKK